MSKREQRVINAFINCVQCGEFSVDYAITLIEDADKYGYLSEGAKAEFYAEFNIDTENQLNESEGLLNAY